ncbi:MAG: M48 family peptidase, partial [Bradyrhizobium sp.]|nr:M48 family peptidase [Bradyrhizobium sp.]
MLSIAPYSKAARIIAYATAAAIAATPMAASAQRLPLIRDTESEQLLRDYTRPILRAAGMEKQNIQMVIINQTSFNAFVADGRRIFVN